MLALLAASGCGPSADEQFQQTIDAAVAAIADDDLDGAAVLLDNGEQLRPGDPELAAIRSRVEMLTTSKAAFDDGMRLAAVGDLLAARSRYLEVAEDDIQRHETALARAVELESAFVEEQVAELIRLIDEGHLTGLPLRVEVMRSGLPDSIAVRTALFQVSARALDALATRVPEQIAARRFNEADAAIDAVTRAFPTSDDQMSSSIDDLREAVAGERQRVEAEMAAEARQMLRDNMTSFQSTGAWGTPRVPRLTEDGCPSPAFDESEWRRCLNDLALAETGCPSVIFDSEAWRECLFGDAGDVVPAPSQSGPADEQPMPAPDSESSVESQLATLRRREEQLVRLYQELWSQNEDAQSEYQRRRRDLLDELDALLGADRLGEASSLQLQIDSLDSNFFLDQVERMPPLRQAEADLASVRDEIRALE